MSISLYSCLKKPILTEKACSMSESADKKKYVFKVNSISSKFFVAKAVEKMFNTRVTSVNIINSKGKKKVFRGKLGSRSDVKKAIVTLDQGLELDMSNVQLRSTK